MKQYLKLCQDGVIARVCENNFESTYEMLRNSVEGRIECVSWIPSLYERCIDIWCNDEGKINGSEPTIAITRNNEIINVICGNVLFARHDEEGKTIHLEEDDFQFIKKLLKKKIVLYCKNQNDSAFIKTVYLIEC